MKHLTTRVLISASALGVACGSLAVDPRNVKPSAPLNHNSAIIDNGVIRLGINDEGHLNVSVGTPVGAPVSIGGVPYAGVRFITPAGDYEATAPGCLCEGWGASAGAAAGYADVSVTGVVGLSLNSFAATPSTAVSDVTLTGAPLQVVHDYHPSAGSPNLYEALVTLKNTGAATLTDVRYVRVMDWDVEPTSFSEYVTIQGTATTTQLLRSHDDGFESPNPLAFNDPINAGTLDVDFVDSGPNDHGAYFQFGFGDLDPDESVTFSIFYGAAGTEAGAEAALGAVGAELYSLGQSNGDPLGGTPATFIFGFKGVGGVPIVPVIPETSTVLGGLALAGLIAGTAWKRIRRS